MWNTRHDAQTRKSNRAKSIYSSTQTMPKKTAANVELVESSLTLNYFTPRKTVTINSHGIK